MTRRLAAFSILVLVAGRASAQDRGDIYAVGSLAVIRQEGPSGESPETYSWQAPGGRYDDSSEPRDIGSVYPGGYPEVDHEIESRAAG